MIFDEKILEYLRLRADKDKLKNRYDDSVANVNTRLSELEEEFKTHLDDNNQKQIHSAYGTVYLKAKTSPKIIDKEKFLRYVLKTGDFDLVTNQPAYLAYNERLNAFLAKGDTDEIFSVDGVTHDLFIKPIVKRGRGK